MSVVIETSIGDLVIDLYVDERPNCCKNFLKLCKIKYYHYCLFHNVQSNYIAQTGDPTGTGRGGESIYSFIYGDQARYFEMERFPIIKHRKLGAVSMINNGQDLHGSQFLITLNENLDYLNGKHTVFGEVAKGFEVLEKFNECLCDKEGRPYQDIRIFHTVILDDPFEDFAALSIENGRASPEPTEERLKSDRIRVDEDLDQMDGMSEEEINKYLEEREAKTRAKLLEIIGDIPDAEMKPPENVLFVCKLNPVTNDEDLELIFSRFGKINSCEVIRDAKTGDSLCYAFIEFDRQEDCENAYFKMDNVLIDDRRIHVDFSQSLAKVNWKGKGTGTGYFEDKRDYRKDDNHKPAKQAEKFTYNRRFEERHAKRGEYELVFDEEKIDIEKGNKYEKSRKYERGSYESRRDRREDDYPRDRDRERDRDRNRDRDRHREKSRDREKDRDRDRDRDREREKDKYRDYKRKEDDHRHRHKSHR